MTRSSTVLEEKRIHLHDDDNGKLESKAGVEKLPETFEVVVRGVCPILFHRWDCGEVELKGKAKKNSEVKKTDNVESYVYRNANGHLCVPGTNFKAALVNASKSKQDPRSPRKAAKDLVNAIIFVGPELAPFPDSKGRPKKDWDFLDKRRAPVQRQGITRVRPAMLEGWTLTFIVTVLDPGYLDEEFVHDLIERAGKYSGLCDHRPQYGRFQIVRFAKML